MRLPNLVRRAPIPALAPADPALAPADPVLAPADPVLARPGRLTQRIGPAAAPAGQLQEDVAQRPPLGPDLAHLKARLDQPPVDRRRLARAGLAHDHAEHLAGLL